MSDFLVELGKTAEKMGDSIGKGIDSAKLRFSVLRLKSDLEASYTELGKYISDHREDLTEDDCLERIAALYEKIDRQKENISLLQEALPRAKSICRACGRSFKREFSYCPYCGSKKIEKPEPEPKPAPCDEAPGESECDSAQAAQAAEPAEPAIPRATATPKFASPAPAPDEEGEFAPEDDLTIGVDEDLDEDLDEDEGEDAEE